jgi:hypothetical protein
MTTEDDDPTRDHAAPPPSSSPADEPALPPLQRPRRLRAKQQTRGIRPADPPQAKDDSAAADRSP